VVAFTGPVDAITVAFPAITVKHFAFAPILMELFRAAVATAVSCLGGGAKGRTSNVTGGRTQSSKLPKDISEGTNIVGNRVVDRRCGTGITLLTEAVNSSQ